MYELCTCVHLQKGREGIDSEGLSTAGGDDGGTTGCDGQHLRFRTMLRRWRLRTMTTEWGEKKKLYNIDSALKQEGNRTPELCYN